MVTTHKPGTTGRLYAQPHHDGLIELLLLAKAGLLELLGSASPNPDGAVVVEAEPFLVRKSDLRIKT